MAPHWKGSLPRSKAALLAEALKQRLTGPVLEAFTAAALLDRVWPKLKPADRPTVFEFPGATFGEHGEAILAAIAEGQMSVSDGSRMIECLQSLAKLAESNGWWFIYGQSARPANAAYSGTRE